MKPSNQVGSSAWLSSERAIIRGIHEEAIEDFVYAARSEFEWLNEHMADIFERGFQM